MATTLNSPTQRRLLLPLLLALSLVLPATVQAQVLVIANPGISLTAISKAELHDVFTGVSTSLKGTAQVMPVLLREGNVHSAFLSLYIGKSDSGFRAGWRSILFSGQGTMPRTLDCDADIVAFVERTPGAIGYISSESPHKGVRVLAVR
ncbi:MAG: hypothetical protein M3O31_05395 [Acidobacteriota bacterium]|nr:hypothetical protein [Acidobacteriota bacterium]